MRRPSNLANPLSLLAIVAPCARQRAARYASGTMLPRTPWSFVAMRAKMSHTASEGPSHLDVGLSVSQRTNLRACSIGVGGEITLGCVTTRKNPEITLSQSERPTPLASSSCNHVEHLTCCGVSTRNAYTNTFTSGMIMSLPHLKRDQAWPHITLLYLQELPSARCPWGFRK